MKYNHIRTPVKEINLTEEWLTRGIGWIIFRHVDCCSENFLGQRERTEWIAFYDKLCRYIYKKNWEGSGAANWKLSVYLTRSSFLRRVIRASCLHGLRQKRSAKKETISNESPKREFQQDSEELVRLHGQRSLSELFPLPTWPSFSTLNLPRQRESASVSLQRSLTSRLLQRW